jgi:predicted Fe-S protein YdhL (DUF1289 family)
MPGADPTPSPCTGICRLERGLCAGCGRTPGEIAAWPAASEAHRREIAAVAAARLEKPNGLG